MKKSTKKVSPIRLKPSFEDVSIDILEATKKPMHYKDIIAEVLKRRPMGGKTPHKTAYSILFKSDYIKRIEPGIFALNKSKNKKG